MPHNAQNKTEAATDGLLSKKEVAARMRVTTRTVENLHHEGLPHYAIGIRRCRYDWAQVKDFLDAKFRVVQAA